MRIALFTETYHPQFNGVVSFLDSILPKLAKNNQVILFAPGDRKNIRVEKRTHSFRIYWIPASPFPYYEGYRMSRIMLNRIERILEKEKVDVVHAHAPTLLGLQGILIAKKMDIPIVATYHTHFPDYLPYLLDGKLPKVFDAISHKTVRGLIRFVYSLVDVPTAPTNELVKELKGYGVKKAVKLVNGVDFSKMKTNKRIEEEFRNKFSIPRNRKIALYVGRIGFEKRLGILLDAAKRLRSKCCLLIVGSGPQLENYKKQAKNLGLKNVVFTGFVDERLLPAAYACADIFVSPSDSETFGLTFIEAMALGKPVIGVNRLGPRELIVNGKGGLLVKPGSSRAIANAIDRLMTNPKLRRKMGAQAKEVAKKYSINQSYKETIEIYRRLKKER